MSFGQWLILFSVGGIILGGLLLLFEAEKYPQPRRPQRGEREREWACPKCGTVNFPGVNSCSKCSAPPLAPAPGGLFYFYIAAGIVCGVMAIVALPTLIGGPIFVLLARQAFEAADRSW